MQAVGPTRRLGVRGYLTPLDSTAIQKASDWANQPTETNRRLCGTTAEDLDYQGVSGTLMLAVFLSGGNIAPEDCEEEVQPEPFSFGQAAAGAVMLATATVDPEDSEKMMESILNSVT